MHTHALINQENNQMKEGFLKQKNSWQTWYWLIYNTLMIEDSNQSKAQWKRKNQFRLYYEWEGQQFFLLNIWYEFHKVFSSMPTRNIKICYWRSRIIIIERITSYTSYGHEMEFSIQFFFDYCWCWWWCFHLQGKD